MRQEEIILGTGNYEFVLNGNRLSIDRDGGNLWCFYGNSYKKLAPEPSIYQKYIKNYQLLKNLTEDSKEYIEIKNKIEYEFIKDYYEKTLRSIDSFNLLEDLNKKFGSNIIILSKEDIYSLSPRRILADYIELETGIYIPEVTVSKTCKVRTLTPKSNKNLLSELITKDK